MREVVELDLREVYAKLQALPPKVSKAPISNEQEWILWEMWPRVNVKTVSEAIHMSYDTAKRHYERLQEQGGPKGPRPEWMA